MFTRGPAERSNCWDSMVREAVAEPPQAGTQIAGSARVESEVEALLPLPRLELRFERVGDLRTEQRVARRRGGRIGEPDRRIELGEVGPADASGVAQARSDAFSDAALEMQAGE